VIVFSEEDSWFMGHFGLPIYQLLRGWRAAIHDNGSELRGNGLPPVDEPPQKSYLQSRVLDQLLLSFKQGGEARRDLGAAVTLRSWCVGLDGVQGAGS